jgi:hypothetical protein
MQNKKPILEVRQLAFAHSLYIELRELTSMPKYSIAFVTPSKSSALRHRIVEADDRDSALRRFFNEEASEFYSNDDQGFYYFKEDFFDEIAASGNIIELG